MYEPVTAFAVSGETRTTIKLAKSASGEAIRVSNDPTTASGEVNKGSPSFS